MIAIWQPQFRKDNPSTKKPLSHADRDHFQEEETLLLRNSIEEEEEEEEEVQNPLGIPVRVRALGRDDSW